MKYLIILCLLFVACLEGPAGPVGPAGSPGPAGGDARTVDFSMTFHKNIPWESHYLSLADSDYCVDQVFVAVYSLFDVALSPLPYTDYSPGFISATLQSKIVYGVLDRIDIEVVRSDNQSGWP
jgi:hypothetical protein